MTEKILSRTQIAGVIAAKTELPQKSVEAVIAEYEAAIAAKLQAGGEVRLPGFGTFKMTDRPARNGRNLHTGEPLEIAARSVVRFVAGKELKQIGAAPKADTTR